MAAVVITGVSRGLGAALFDELYERGDRILALGRHFTDEQLQRAQAAPDRLVLRPTDLSDGAEGLPGAVELAAFLTAGDPPDQGVPAGAEPTVEPAVLIHNAGAVTPVGAIGTLDPTELVTTMQVNLVAPMLLTNAFLTARVDRPVTVLFISSGAAKRVIDGWATYCASKAGGEMFFDAVASQYADDPSVTVHNVSPGVIDTEMQAVLRASGESYFPEHSRFVGLAERGELQSPEQVARRIMTEYLAVTDG